MAHGHLRADDRVENCSMGVSFRIVVFAWISICMGSRLYSQTQQVYQASIGSAIYTQTGPEYTDSCGVPSYSAGGIQTGYWGTLTLLSSLPLQKNYDGSWRPASVVE